MAGALAGWRVASPTAVETDIGRVSLAMGPSLTGEAIAFVPLADWGLRADAFDAPFELRAELRSLRRDGLLRAAEGGREVLASTEEELRDGAERAVISGILWALGGAVLLLLLATLTLRLRRRWLLLAIGVPLALVLAGATALAARSTFDSEAFESPTYFARGAELQRILEIAGQESVESEYGSVFASVLRSVSAVLAEANPAAEPTRDLYLASDLHANALVVAPLARQVGDAPLILAGDFGQRGGEAEARALAPRVAALGTRVVAVAGNHDSSTVMEELATQGVTVLEGDRAEGAASPSPTLDLDGLLVAGFPDPLFWEGAGDPDDRPVTFDDLDDPEAAFDSALRELTRWFARLPRAPDVVVVHQNALAQAFAEDLLADGRREPLTVLTGHDHRQHIDRYGPVTVVDAGSVGAGGLFGAGEEAIGLAQLHFDPRDPVLRSVDLVQVEPFTQQAQATRIAIAELCPGEERCRFEPVEIGSSPAAE